MFWFGYRLWQSGEDIGFFTNPTMRPDSFVRLQATSMNRGMRMKTVTGNNHKLTINSDAPLIVLSPLCYC